MTDDEPISEAERQRLLAEYEDLARRAEQLQRDMHAHSRGQTRWDRIGLIVLALVAVGALLYWLTGSVLWATVGVVVGVPVLGIAAVVAVAFVQDARARSRDARTRTVGEATVVMDLDAREVRLTHSLPPEAKLTLYPALFDFAVTRYGAQYDATRDHGGRLVAPIASLADAALAQLEGGARPPELDLDPGPWTVVDALDDGGRRLDIGMTLGELDGVTSVSSHTEPMMGTVDKGEAFCGATRALLIHALTSGEAPARGLAAGLRVQCEAFRRKGSKTPRGASMRLLLSA